MKDTDYTYAVAYIRTLENKMLTAGTLEAILNSESYEDAVKLIHDSGFSKNGSDSDSVDGLIKKELEYAWSEAREVCPAGAPLDVLLYKNDFHNLKTVLKAVITDTAWENLIIKPCITEPQAICDAIKNTDFSELPKFMSEACERAYKIITETHDGQKAEVYADRKCLEEMKKRADKEKNEFLTGWVDLNIVIANMKIAARAVGRSKDFISSAMVKNEDSHYERLTEAALSSFDSVCDAVASIGYPEAAEKLKESLSDFELWCDNKRMEYIKKAKRKCFGFDPIIAFLIAKEYELQAVRIILSGKLNGVPVNILSERLRDMYV